MNKGGSKIRRTQSAAMLTRSNTDTAAMLTRSISELGPKHITECIVVAADALHPPHSPVGECMPPQGSMVVDPRASGICVCRAQWKTSRESIVHRQGAEGRADAWQHLGSPQGALKGEKCIEE